MKKVLVPLILAALILGVGWTYWRRDTPATTVFQTAEVQRGDLVVSISATGTVEPEEVIDVGAQVAGQILSFGKDANGNPVDYCSPVEAGTVLAKIDDALYTSEVTQAQAQVLSARGGLQRAEADLNQLKAKLYQAEHNWNRAQQLMQTSTLADTEYVDYKTAFETATASVLIGEAAIVQARGSLAQAEGMLERAQRNLGFTTITSPVKGVIIDRRVNTGQTVVASLNTPSLFLIAKDLTRIQVWAAVNEGDIGRLRTGQPVTFTVDAFPGESFNGQVGKIRLNASMTQNVVTYTVEVVADNSNGLLLPYLTANVKFELDRRDNVLMIPNAALRWTPTTDQVAADVRAAFEQQSAAASPSALAGGAASQPASGPGAGVGQGVVWVADGRLVRPVFVRLGLSDDVMTEVAGEGLTEGTKLVTGLEEVTSASASTNPFLPKPPNGGKGGPPPPM